MAIAEPGVAALFAFSILMPTALLAQAFGNEERSRARRGDRAIRKIRRFGARGKGSTSRRGRRVLFGMEGFAAPPGRLRRRYAASQRKPARRRSA